MGKEANEALFNMCARRGSVTYTSDSLAEASGGVRADWYELDTAHEDVELFDNVVNDAVTRSVSQCIAVSECRESHFLKQMHTIKSKGSRRYMCEGQPLQK